MMRTLTRATLSFAILAICYFQISQYIDLVDAGRLTTLLRTLGFSVLVILIPYLCVILCDTCGWMLCFDSGWRRLSTWKLPAVRLATETLQCSLPGGAVFAECTRPFLLTKHFGVASSESISAGIITKVNIFLAQGVFIVCGGLLAFAGNFNTSLSGLELCGAASITLAIPFALAYLLYRRNLILWCIRLMETCTLKTTAKLLLRVRQPMLEISNTISLFTSCHIRLMSTVAVFLFSWLLMSFESLVILRIMGVDAGIHHVVIIESLISLVRIVFFFIPGAIGPQDVSLVFLFHLAGVPDPLINSALFVVLRRAKELFWILAGYILLFALGIRPDNLHPSGRNGAGGRLGALATSEAS